MNKKYFYLLLLPCFLFLLIFMVIPILVTTLSSFYLDGRITLEGYRSFLTDHYFLNILFRTLRISLLTTTICIILGFPVAYYVSKLNVKLKFIFIAAAVFPLLISPVVRSFSWMAILGREGIFNTLLKKIGIINEPIQFLYTELAIVIGLVHLFLPLMIIALIGVMENIDYDLVKAAQSLGASRFTSFIKIVFPLSVPGLVVGSVLVFVGSLTAYTTPQLLGGSRRVMSTLLYQQSLTLNNWYTASIIATIMIVATFIIIGIMNKIAQKLNPKG
ncbi:ABC transporter permease [Evansella sp. AB-P1]|uniref:ABC transporter permease n=1 Tax=Evansella sp. AB-P1 TaxID=3037653 RepID=UPI00241F0171|nr:ABC transporter permease [Evansella sp. AB-P1]MDG5789281.1 ABC transporter permease [Evansella sp. AB-P1]